MEFINKLSDNKVLSVIGLVVALYYAWGLLFGIYARCFRPAKSIVKKYGKYAVVTGATDGIGRAMAFELAKKGCNLILISRNIEKLLATQKEIIDKYSQAAGG